MSKYAIKPFHSQISHEPSLIPRIPGIVTVVSPVGLGKSTLLNRLVTEPVFFKGQFERIVIFSPTFYLDPKWTSVLSIKGVVKRPSHESTEETIDLVAPRPEKRRFTGRIRPEDVHTEYSEDVLEELVDSQKEYQELYGKAGTPQCPIIFEDVAGLNLFSGKTGTRYIKLINTLRHYKISIWTAIQLYKLLPRTVRINTTNLIFFRICNKVELRKYMRNFLWWAQWFDLFQELTKEDYSFVHLSMQNPPKYQLIQNFDRFVAH